MECEIRRARYLSEISSVRELKEARRELELREWFARERLEADIYDTFTLDNLVSMVAPPGSILDRVIGGVGTGFAAVQGIFGVLGSLFGGRRPEVRRPAVRKRAVTPLVAKPAAVRPAVRKKAVAKPAVRSVVRKRTPEIEVEVELEKPRTARSARSRKKS